MAITIAWNNLTARVGDKIILNSLSGGFPKSSINGVMGPSGCGKTTLMKCLNSSNKYGLSCETKIFLKTSPGMSSVFIYQDQNQRVMTGLTVNQSLTYASKLKNSNVDGVNHSHIVSQVMKELLIDDIQDNRIEKCSSGQVKRVCIGLELTAVQKPELLFLDEPTTGLDSNAAEVMIECLQFLAVNHNICVICSIHQPNNQLFQMFDNIYVLAKGGHQLYSGSPHLLRPYLSEVGIRCDANEVPIEVLLKYSSLGLKDSNVKRMNEKCLNQMQELIDYCNTNMKSTERGMSRSYKPFKAKDLWTLVSRFVQVTFVSNSRQLLIRLALIGLMNISLIKLFNSRSGTIDGCFSLNSTSDKSCVEIEDEKSLLYASCNYLFLSTLFMSIFLAIISTPSIADHFNTFYSEYNNGWYSVSAFFWSKSISDTLVTFKYSLVLTCFIYFGFYKLNDPTRLAWMLYVNLALLMCCQAIYSMVGIVMSREKYLGLSVSMMIVVVSVTYNNFYIRVSDMSQIQQQMSEFVFMKYAFNSLVIIVYGIGRCQPYQLSKGLLEYGIEDDQVVYSYIWRFPLVFFVLFVLEFVILWMKVKFNWVIDLSMIKSIQTNEDEDLVLSKAIDVKNNNEELAKEMMIAWLDISVVINKKRLLDGISGSFNIHSLNALMGPSGAGKTTLLKCLNGRYNHYLSGGSKLFVRFANISRNVFIQQEISEHLLSGLTVRQTLIYASRLKNSRIDKNLDHNLIVSDVLSELLISDTIDSRVESCSGGEQKRIAIACELTAHLKPNILCIDEPTSGLDSNAAQVVIDCLKKLVRHHKMTIIVSIHQPNQELLHSFDNIYVLAKGGLNIYSGRPQDLNNCLMESNIERKNNQIAIEVLLKCAYNGLQNRSIERLTLKRNEKRKQISNLITSQRLHRYDTIDWIPKMFSFKDFWLLLKRSMANSYVSNWKAVTFQCLIYLMVGLVIRTHFNPQIIGPDGCLDIDYTTSLNCNQTYDQVMTENLIKQNMKYIFLSSTSLASFIIIIVAVTFLGEVKIIKSQYQNGWFSAGAYMWTKTVADIIPIVITLIPYCVIIDMNPGFKLFFGYYLTLIPTIICTQCLAQISSLVFVDDTKTAIMSSLIHFNILGLMSNGLIPLRTTHYSVQLLSELSYFKFTIETIVLLNYGFGRCNPEQLSTVLYALDIDDTIFWPNIIKLTANAIIYKLFTLLLFLIKFNAIGQKQTKRTKHDLQELDKNKSIDIF